MAVAVNPLHGCADTRGWCQRLDQLLRDALVGLALTLAQPGTLEYRATGLLGHGAGLLPTAMGELAAQAHLVDASYQLTQGEQMVGVLELGRLAGQVGKQRHAVAPRPVQTLASVVAPGGRHRHPGIVELTQEGVLLADGLIAQPVGAVELGHPTLAVIVLHQIDAVLVAVERKGLAGQPQAQ